MALEAGLFVNPRKAAGGIVLQRRYVAPGGLEALEQSKSNLEGKVRALNILSKTLSIGAPIGLGFFLTGHLENSSGALYGLLSHGIDGINFSNIGFDMSIPVTAVLFTLGRLAAAHRQEASTELKDTRFALDAIYHADTAIVPAPPAPSK